MNARRRPVGAGTAPDESFGDRRAGEGFGLQDPDLPSRVEQLPREVGVLLLVTGMITGLLPPPPGPFDLSLMAAGGVALWPRGVRAVEGWTRRRFPWAHRAGMAFLDRYLDDLEQRYPGATNAVEYERRTLIRMLGDLAGEEASSARRPDDRAGGAGSRAGRGRDGEFEHDQRGG